MHSPGARARPGGGRTAAVPLANPQRASSEPGRGLPTGVARSLPLVASFFSCSISSRPPCLLGPRAHYAPPPEALSPVCSQGIANAPCSGHFPPQQLRAITTGVGALTGEPRNAPPGVTECPLSPEDQPGPCTLTDPGEAWCHRSVPSAGPGLSGRGLPSTG